MPKNSVILTTRAPIGKVAIAAQELCTNQGCKSLVINEKINSHFLYYLLSSSNERLNTLGTGTTFMELGATALGNIKIALPPLEEQTTIATFLDERTAYIDQLIAKQQALSEKLSEKRTALITEAVCGRLNTNAEKLRDSGVQWLGKVPEHWEVKKFKYLCKIITGYTPSKNVRFAKNWKPKARLMCCATVFAVMARLFRWRILCPTLRSMQKVRSIMRQIF